MTHKKSWLHLAWPFLVLMAANHVAAAPLRYVVDPEHTYPSFEADHMGLSIWRGKFNETNGVVTWDKAANRGTVDVTVNMESVDFGHDTLNRYALGPDLFDTAKYPRARYQGTLIGADGKPQEAKGELSLHGVTKPLALKIHSFKCVPHPLFKRELCGADASGVFQRDAFGMDAGKDYGFKMDVVLRIQIEAIRPE